MNTRSISPRLPEDETELTDFLSEKRRSSKTQSNTEEPQPVLRKFSNDPETIELSNQQSAITVSP